MRFSWLGTSLWKPGVWLLLVVLATTSGCYTTLGWVPDNVKPRKLADSKTLTPKYVEVKQWAYDVQDAYDSRETINRQAAYFGALFAVAAAGAMAGLAVFSSGSSAIAGIPIGAGFLSGTAAVYNNNVKADMYGRASAYVKQLINVSDKRIEGFADEDVRFYHEANCLKIQVDKVMWLVEQHIAMMDPQNVVAALAAINTSSTGAPTAPNAKPQANQPKPKQPAKAPTSTTPTPPATQPAGQSTTQTEKKESLQVQVNKLVQLALGKLDDLNVPDNLTAQVANDCDGQSVATTVQGIAWFGPINIRFRSSDQVFLIDASPNLAPGDKSSFEFFTDNQAEVPIDPGRTQTLRDKLEFDTTGSLFIVKLDDLNLQQVRSVSYTRPSQTVKGITWFGPIKISFEESKKVFMISSAPALAASDKNAFEFFTDNDAEVAVDKSRVQTIRDEKLKFDSKSQQFSVALSDLQLAQIKSVIFDRTQ